ncbi:MAG: GIY-YIG nuclease family protein, partial [bacterium]
MKYYTYILKSKIAERYYVGSTNDLERRINEHNTRKDHWTYRFQPWEVIHFEEFANRSEAVVKEKRLKSKYG